MMRYFKQTLFGMVAFLLISCQPEDKFYVAYYDEKTELYGLKDQSGTIILSPRYQGFEKHPATYHEGGDINKATKLFHPSHPETEYLVPVIKSGGIFRIALDGTIKFASVAKDYGGGHDTNPDFIRFIEEGKVGFHNRKGDVVIPSRYEYAGPFKNGYALICEGCEAQDKTPKIYYAPISQYIHPEEKGCSCFHAQQILKGGKWGAVDTSGKEVVPLTYENTQEVEKVLKKKFGWVYGIAD